MPIQRERLLKIAIKGLHFEKARIEKEIAQLEAERAQCEREAAEIEAELNQKPSESEAPSSLSLATRLEAHQVGLEPNSVKLEAPPETDLKPEPVSLDAPTSDLGPRPASWAEDDLEDSEASLEEEASREDAAETFVRLKSAVVW